MDIVLVEMKRKGTNNLTSCLRVSTTIIWFCMYTSGHEFYMDYTKRGTTESLV